MGVSEGEWDLIERIRRRQRTSEGPLLGIGDDAALLATSGQCVVAADMILEGVHFTVDTAQPAEIGHKALAVNLSDLAAMAAWPTAAFVSVAHRRELGFPFADELHRGIDELAARFDVAIAGGDTNVWDGPLVVAVTVLGEPRGERIVKRDGARSGDRLFVTGPLGGSFGNGRHLTFTPRLDEAQWLHRHVELHAMIDISDGLLSETTLLCEAGGVGARLQAGAIPIHADVDSEKPVLERLTAALTDGEDFELLFAVDPNDAQRLHTGEDELRLVEVGEVVASPEIVLLDERGTPLKIPTAGYRHRW